MNHPKTGLHVLCFLILILFQFPARGGDEGVKNRFGVGIGVTGGLHILKSQAPELSVFPAAGFNAIAGIKIGNWFPSLQLFGVFSMAPQMEITALDSKLSGDLGLREISYGFITRYYLNTNEDRKLIPFLLAGPILSTKSISPKQATIEGGSFSKKTSGFSLMDSDLWWGWGPTFPIVPCFSNSTTRWFPMENILLKKRERPSPRRSSKMNFHRIFSSMLFF